MQTFFIIDDTKDLDKKINMIINNIGDDIKFFVKANLYTQISGNATVMHKTAGVFKNNEKSKIDEYLHNEKCTLDTTLLYYSSVNIDDKLLMNMRNKAMTDYDTVFVKPKRNIFQRFCSWIYQKFTLFLYRVQDVDCSTKLQIMSKRFVEYLQQTTFCNHILDVKYKVIIEAEKNTNLTPKTKFSKFYLYDIIAFLVILMSYVLLEVFLDLRFFVYFAIVLGVVLTIIVALMIACFYKFNTRSKYKTK